MTVTLPTKGRVLGSTALRTPRAFCTAERSSVAAAGVSRDLPAAAVLHVAELIERNRHDRVGCHVPDLPGRSHHFHRRRWAVGVALSLLAVHDTHEIHAKLVDHRR